MDLTQLATVEMDIAIWLQCQPKIVMELLNEEAKDFVLKEFPEYSNIHEDIFVRLEAIIEENIRDLRCSLCMLCLTESVVPSVCKMQEASSCSPTMLTCCVSLSSAQHPCQTMTPLPVHLVLVAYRIVAESHVVNADPGAVGLHPLAAAALHGKQVA